MCIRLGIDVGAVGVKAALVFPKGQIEPVLSQNEARGVLCPLATPAGCDLGVLLANPRRTRGRPLDVTRDLLDELTGCVPAEQIDHMAFTGSGAALVAETLGAPTCNDFQACTRAIDLLHRSVRTVFEIGGESSRYIQCEPDPGSGTLGILDYGANGDCAAGTGAFLDQQASRLQFAVEQIGEIVEQAERAAQIAGRCSVFAKSDMIHAQQKGYDPAEVLRGLCNAVARNFKSAVVKGRSPRPPIALVGGVSANTAVVRALREAFDLRDDDLFVPEAAHSLGAVGAALIAGEVDRGAGAGLRERLARLRIASDGNGYAFPTAPPLSMERVTLLRDEGGAESSPTTTQRYPFPKDGTLVDAYLGLDIGSVGTKLVLIDESGDVIHSIFTRTDGRPIEVVSRCLRETEEAIGWGVRIRAVGSTGSGRELIGELVGADSINDEITAHKTGATFVGDRLLGKRPDTIFEIGGQDSKYISLQPEDGTGGTSGTGGTCGTGVPPVNKDSTSTSPPDTPTADTIVVDFTMNEACAAGTGSFLEERAEELGVSIKDQFAELALSSKAPLRLGERCTVFMERDVNTYMQRGAKREDIIAGLAYSIAHNYINRVVRGRPIGDCVFFQGGTAYNNAVAAAFSMITGKEIIVPPHNAVLGAIGAALLAREKVTATAVATRFRGYDLEQVDYTLREFTCKGCGNHCSIQEFNVQGEKTFWGDKCSDRYRKRAKTERKPAVPDLVALHRQLLHDDDCDDPPQATATIGIPLAMYSFDLLPLWRRFFHDCGFRVVVSSETNRRTVQMGLDSTVAEPCFPIIVAHGHVAELVSQNVDFLWLPNILTTDTKQPSDETCYVCPWGQTLPYVIRQAPMFRSWRDRILAPTIRMDDGTKRLKQLLVKVAGNLGTPRKIAERAFSAALNRQRRFRTAYADAGREALETLEASGQPGMVLVGRPYNIHDPGVSLSTARKLREHYGVNVLPIDALPLDDIDVSDVNDNMYWAYGKRILAAAKLVGQHSHLHIVYITNFKCGPDSFLKGFIRPASGKPFLTLQFDGHSNDAGTMTRCEAYLDSKGILRWWRTCKSKPLEEVSRDAPSTSPRCPTPVRG